MADADNGEQESMSLEDFQRQFQSDAKQPKEMSLEDFQREHGQPQEMSLEDFQREQRPEEGALAAGVRHFVHADRKSVV